MCNEDGTVVVPERLTGRFRDFIEMPPEIPEIRFHDLRHTAASLLLLQGVHPKVVSERLGHSDIRLTLTTYSHLLPGIQEEAQKLDGARRHG